MLPGDEPLPCPLAAINRVQTVSARAFDTNPETTRMCLQGDNRKPGLVGVPEHHDVTGEPSPACGSALLSLRQVLPSDGSFLTA